MEKQKHRNEIDDKYKWDLTTIYKTEDDFLKEYDEVKEKINDISKYEELINKDLTSLYDLLKLKYDLYYKADKLFLYARSLYDTETYNEKYQEYFGKISNLYHDLSKATSYIEPSLFKYDYEDIKKEISRNPKLEEFKFVLENTFREKEHTLSKTEEKLISNLGKALDKSDELFDIITDTDFTFGTIKDENGKDVELTESNYVLYLESDDQRVRKDAYDTLYKQYKQYRNTLSKTLSNHIDSTIALSRIRKYDSVLDQELYNDNISKDVFNTLIDTVSNNLEPIYKYYRLKKEFLGYNDLHFYDIYYSDSKYSKKYSYEEAKELCINTLEILGSEYVNNIKKAFDERWIDVFNTKGKRGGGYSTGIKGTNPFILYNFEGTIEDVSGLIHELGHSMHTLYSNENNTFQDSFYTIFVGEVASTVNELLLANHILEKSNSNEEKIAILTHLIDMYKATLFRQTMFQEFEHKMYELASKDVILTSDLMSEEYLKLLKKYFGDTVVYDDNIKYEFLRIPHFYNNYYVFTYATGISYATKIATDIINNKENAKEKYLEFLKTGGSMYPMDELKIANVDVHDKNVYLNTINYFDKLVNDYKALIKKVK